MSADVPHRRFQFSLRMMFSLVFIAAIIVALANGNHAVAIAILCWLGLISLMGGWMHRAPRDAKPPGSASDPFA
jgi:hypothetical protein